MPPGGSPGNHGPPEPVAHCAVTDVPPVTVMLIDAGAYPRWRNDPSRVMTTALYAVVEPGLLNASRQVCVPPPETYVGSASDTASPSEGVQGGTSSSVPDAAARTVMASPASVPVTVAVTVVFPPPFIEYVHTKDCVVPAAIVSGPVGTGPDTYDVNAPPAFTSSCGTTRSASAFPAFVTLRMICCQPPAFTATGETITDAKSAAAAGSVYLSWIASAPPRPPR